ncbi:amino acid permease [Legionella sp. W05-934-2]|jgi:APA family basic amino acid/polyamine antiporter|uniref:amino acid permease n=1 Tax=Legionella sp. W05-934-2 TaxID=1198649 RepID=UPI00346372C7
MDLMRRKPIQHIHNHESQLMQCLSAWDLTFLGIGAIIGAGIFVLTGFVAATQAGPGIIFCYILAGLACAFSAISYAELAAFVGGCGSAYGYAYAGFGELLAWIVGWDLLLEYGIATSAVSVGWSGYANDFLTTIHLNVPNWLLHGPLNHGYINSLAFLIIAFLTVLLSMGVMTSARFNKFIVFVKLGVILIFIAIASFHVETKNWSPFLPYGWEGVVQGASLIFFAYIGFDAVSTAAEEAINPQRDLPRGIIASLAICTVVYMLVSFLLTGIVPFDTLNNASPISNSLIKIGHHFAAGLIGVGAIAGLTTVMLVLFYGLTRVFLAISRDGLLPHWFAKTHPKTKAPMRIIIMTGLVMALTGGLMPISDLAELVNIGTLFAFMLVCGGVIVLRYRHPEIPRPFKTPWMPYIPILGILSCAYLIFHLPWLTMVRFAIWMLVGLVIYAVYGYKNSRLNGAIIEGETI